jgi:hypothetical protein
MCDLMDTKRRHFLQTAGIGAAGLAATGFGLIATTRAQTTSLPNQPVSPGVAITMGPIRHIRTDILNIGYFETGPSGGQVVLLLHGYPYDIHSFVDVAPMLAAQGYRVIVPYLRGHGSTRFLDAATPRAGQQGAIGADVTALMDTPSKSRPPCWPVSTGAGARPASQPRYGRTAARAWFPSTATSSRISPMQ